MNPQAEAKRFIDEKETAKLLNVSIFTLRGQRHARRGLPFYKFGRSVRYKLSEVLNYMDSLRVETAASGCEPLTASERQRTEAEARAAAITAARGYLDGLPPATKEGRQRMKGAL